MSEFTRPLGSYWIEWVFRGMSTVARFTPSSNAKRQGLVEHRNIPYLDGAGHSQSLDIYHPVSVGKESPASERRPIILFVHGGSFFMLSKECHRGLAMRFAKAGYVVFNINYRLAPRDPFPRPLEDVCAAYEWVLDHAAEYGGDAKRLIVTGESAGGNLITALTLATVWKRDEEFARRVYERNVVPILAAPFCPMLSVSRPGRFKERKANMPEWMNKKIHSASRLYIQNIDHGPTINLADPLLGLESDAQFDRPLPPFFVPIGTRDPILDDSRRLGVALQNRGVAVDVRYYPQGIHAFHGFAWQKPAKDCWQDTYDILARHAPHKLESVVEQIATDLAEAAVADPSAA